MRKENGILTDVTRQDIELLNSNPEEFWRGVTSIGDEAFVEREELEHIEIPNSVTSIGEQAFGYCTSLREVVIPDSVTYIGKYAFSSCSELEDVSLSNSLTRIGNYVFNKCTSLRTIKIPSSVTNIGDYAFNECDSLENVEIPNSVTNISTGAFAQCSSLEQLEIPKSVTHIGWTAFEGCLLLENINIEKLSKHNFEVIREINNLSMEVILTKTNDVFSLELFKNGLEYPNDNQRKINIFLSNYYAKFFDDENACQKLDKIDQKFSRYIFERSLAKYKEKENINYEEIFSCNTSNISKILKSTDEKFKSEQDEISFYKFCENLGVLNSQPTTVRSITKSGEEKVRQIDYAQMSREFIKDRLADGSLSLKNMYNMFGTMKFSGFKREFADFFFNKENFKELIAEETLQPGFISRCYNEFEKVQLAHTSNRGKQRRLAPTVSFFKGYFAENKFEGVTEETVDIATTIGPYFHEQHYFNKAVEINKERIDSGVKDSILDGERIEDDIFSRAERLVREVKEIATKNTSNLVDLANNEFTFEFLSKSDPLNFILGKLCDCCAHLDGAGNGIMRASIVHPDLQNIVIRDRNGNIVAKSTLYVNRKEGYGVCNNVEVNADVNEKDLPLIYKSFKKAISKFAKRYNEKYPNQPLKVINVGMGANDLTTQITAQDQKSKRLYKGFNFGEYDDKGYGHNSDSDGSQYTIWSNEELNNGVTL